MATKTAKPEYSAGARYERKALRAYLTRLIGAIDREMDDPGMKRIQVAYQNVLRWVQTREKRYDKKPGGL